MIMNLLLRQKIIWVLLFGLIYSLNCANCFMINRPRNESKKYALLVGGGTSKDDTSESFYKNIEYVYQTLIKIGYNEKNVKVLFFDGKPTNHPIVDGNANKASFIDELYRYETIIDSNDSLLIFRSGHGTVELIFEKYGILVKEEILPEGESINIIGSDAVMCFPDDPLSSFEFQEILGRIKAKQIIVILNQCYSGKFTEIANNISNTVVISETEEIGLGFISKRSTKSWKSSVWPFVKCMFDGLLENGKDGKKRSINEAFQYMLECNPNIEGIGFRADRPPWRESPQIKYGSDLIIGSIYIY